MSMSDRDPSDFWNFSIQHYARPGVAESCLALQDTYGLDVNLVLFFLWYGNHYGELSSSQFNQVLNFSSQWAANVVNPVRQQRRWLKQHRETSGIDPDIVETYRNKVKRLELDAEQLQQNQLQALALIHKTGKSAEGMTAVNSNLERYLAWSDIDQDVVITRHLETIVGGTAGS